MKGNKQPWTQEELRYVLDNYKSLNKVQIAEGLKKIGPGHSAGSVKALYTKYGLVSGIDSHFKKGHISANKGVKLPPEMYEKLKKTMFKKGNQPYNTLKIGDEVITTNGYIKVKIGEPNKWKQKHRLVWEQYKGPIPKGYKITFLDGNILNCNIDNLVLVTDGECLTLNRNYRKAESPEERQVQIDIVRIDRLVRKAEKGKKNEK